MQSKKERDKARKKKINEKRRIQRKKKEPTHERRRQRKREEYKARKKEPKQGKGGTEIGRQSKREGSKTT